MYKSKLNPRPLSRFTVIVALFWCHLAFAYATVEPTPLQWNALPNICKNNDFARFVPPAGQHYVVLSPYEKALKWKVGGWHYCTGLVWLMRAESGTDPEAVQEALGHAARNMNWSLSKINWRNPWAAEMAVNWARMLSLSHKPEEALKTLDRIRPLHPDYAPIYLTYTVLLFDSKDYRKAAKILESGNQATGDRNGQLQYFLGVALYHIGDIAGARKYLAKAKAHGFDLPYLPGVLEEYDRTHGTVPKSATP